MGKIYSFACSSLGFSHIQSGKVCQDSSEFYADDIVNIAVVSDGHGSADFIRSDKGSRFACNCSIEAIKEFVFNVDVEQLKVVKTRDVTVEQLCKNILLRWNQCVDEDFVCSPFSNEELECVSEKYKYLYENGKKVEHAYGCTLIVVIYTKDYFLAIRNGDGQCVVVDDAGFSTPIPWNDRCELNITTSLCDNMAITDFRYFYSDKLPIATFIGSDGVDNSYSSIDDLYHMYLMICLDAINSGFDIMKENIIDFLPKLTERGSMDDVSIAGIINEDALINISSTLIEQSEKYKKLKAEEKKQRELAIKKRVESDLIKKIEKAKEKKMLAEKEKENIAKEKEGIIKKLLHFKENNKELDNEILSIDEEVLKLQEELDILLEQEDEEQQVDIDTSTDSTLEQFVEDTDVFAKIVEDEFVYDSSRCNEDSEKEDDEQI